MKMKRIYNIMVIIPLMLLQSCIKDNIDIPSSHEIAFTSEAVAPEKVGTRSTIDNTSLRATGWGVFAYYTGPAIFSSPAAAEGIIFNNRKVYNASGSWDYALNSGERGEYWPTKADDKFSFFAYAPYSPYGPYGTAAAPTLSIGGNGPVIKYTAPDSFSEEKDLVWGTNTSGLPHRNVSRTSFTTEDVVDMHFRHAPAKLRFTINGSVVLENDVTIDLGTSPVSSTTEYGAETKSSIYYYRQATQTTITESRKITETGTRIFVEDVSFKNFLKQGTLHLNNADPFTPSWTASDDESNMLSYDISTALTSNPVNEAISYNKENFGSGWGTVYTGVNSDTQELFSPGYRHLYIIPKTADRLQEDSKNIVITVKYHVVAIVSTEIVTTTTVRTYWQRRWEAISSYSGEFTDSSHQPSTTTSSSTSYVTEIDYSNDNAGADGIGQGWHAKGSISTDILGGRDYTINLFLNGRDLTLTAVPQPWDLEETTYDYNESLNPIIAPLTYDPSYVDKVEGGSVYINNRTGRFTFNLGAGKYVYWQASLIGDDAFAFTDADGRYIPGAGSVPATSIRGATGSGESSLYIKAVNTSSGVTSRAKLRIYLFDSNNHATVALPKSGWKFIDNDDVLEWQIVQNAN